MSCEECKSYARRPVSVAPRPAPRREEYCPAPAPRTYTPMATKAYVPECDCNFTIAELSSRPGQYMFNIDGCSAKLDIRAGVKQNETLTHLNADGLGNLVYTNEHDVKEKVHIKDLLPFGNLEDLGNVEDRLDDGCAFLFKGKNSDQWKTWKTETHTLQPSEKAAGVMVFTENGCPRYLPAPTDGLSTLVARDGVVKWETLKLPAGADKDAFKPAWGNTNHTKAVDNNGVPNRKDGIFTHNPEEDKCNDTTFN